MFPSVHTTRTFPSDASIVLIGIRGTGKSSLGVLASSAFRRQLVDADQYFYRSTGFHRATYRRDHSAADYRAREVQVLRSMLAENDKGYIIACGPGCVEEDGRDFLQEYAKTHPVIHVLREQEAIQKYLKIAEAKKIAHLIEISEPIYRSCSNLEFYNLTEVQLSEVMVGRRVDTQKEECERRCSPDTPSLALKQVEHDFLRFLGFITHQHAPHQIATKPGSLGSYVSTEQGAYTYALVLPLSKLVDGEIDIEAVETGVDAIELSVDMPLNVDSHAILDDYYSPRNVSRQLARLRRKTTVPIIFSSQALENLPPSTPSAIIDLYFDLLHYGLRLGVEYVAVNIGFDDEKVLELLAEKGPTKVIGQLSNNEARAGGWDDPDCLARYHRARLLGCDIVRMSQHAVTMEDNVAMLRFRKQVDSLDYPHPPLITYNTGFVGRMSSCLSPFLTPVTHPILRAGGTPGHATMISAQEAQMALYANFVFDRMHFCTFGGAVAYSLSPAMHGGASAACGMPHSWRVHESTSVRDLLRLCEDENFGGACISSPFKIEVTDLLWSMSSHAKAIGAVNSVITIRELADQGLPEDISLRASRNHSGAFKALYGDNTDWIGIRACIRNNLSPANAISHHTTGLVIGAGGMARAAIYAMLQLGVSNIFIYNRTYMKAMILAEHFMRQESVGWRPVAAVGDGPPELQPKHKIHVLASVQDPWPKPYRYPTIAVCCIPAHSIGNEPATNFTLPTQWLQSPTGGVVLEVSPPEIDDSCLDREFYIHFVAY